ncbi:alpha-amylase [Pseudomonas benzenivorans]|uniref:Alpha-amylase n=1 Tax=Pseudomonas benzenivorans TaxID=556533 RepID=A0ABZ0Q0Y5_9PSED|nr:alpha-amylase [Pseudomonas benzenivorans]WPC06861.1 alpha-amylase [Pseudomonas benzenivorans]
MHRLSRPTLGLTALILGLLARSACAEPPLQARLDQRPLPLSWSADGPGRYSIELDLQPGLLRLQAPAPAGNDQPLRLYQRQDWQADSRLSLQVQAPGRYRLLYQEGDQAHLRLLPIKAPASSQGCPRWQGEALDIDVSQVFAEGQAVRDAYSGQLTRVEGGRVRLTPAPDSEGLLLLEAAEAPAQSGHDWRNATVYFVLTDRFANGDPDNDHSYGRQADGEQEIGTFHGGDLKGLTGKLDYLEQLGVNALWISAPYEQIHGWVGGGDAGDFRHYGYHGYYALDYTQLDANMGRENELRALIEQAHARGIHVLFDVVLNHPGYPTLADMQAHGFGALRDGMAQYLPANWADWTPEPFENQHAYHNLIDYQHPAWATWWGKDWVRAGIADYPQPPSVLVDPLKGSLAFLPDFRTESEQAVALPAFLKHKQPTQAVEREGYRVRDYLIEWLTFWVREFGVDGFRADTVKHVEMASWAALRQAADQARADWSRANPDDPMSGSPFWMVGEVFGQGPQTSAYQANGFDALINFDLQRELAGRASDCLDQAEKTYQDYAELLANNPGHNFMSYASSHDTSLFFAERGKRLSAQRGLGAALLLSPGAVQLYYGDESARPLGPSGSDPQQGTRSPMNWAEHDRPEIAALIRHWQILGQFRARHPAIGAGQHQRLSTRPYAFARSLGEDRVVIVQGGQPERQP